MWPAVSTFRLFLVSFLGLRSFTLSLPSLHSGPLLRGEREGGGPPARASRQQVWELG